MTDENESIYYNVHHNYEWVVLESLIKLGFKDNLINCKRIKDFPSQNHTQARPEYSLFRVETNLSSIWMTSKAFCRLDSKDYLFHELNRLNSPRLMPDTILIEWDANECELIPDLPTIPCFLKAPCGSGGFGIYKVESKHDILSIIKYHYHRAITHEGFVESLRAQNYGSIPKWSLQRYLESIRVQDNRKCQIRAYAMYCNQHIYIYDHLEVRLPYWTENHEDVTIPSSQDMKKLIYDYETECCQYTNAVPYNKYRLKENTERYMLHELSELSAYDRVIKECVMNMLKTLHPSIIEQVTNYDIINVNSNISRNIASICGIDILLHEETIDVIKGENITKEIKYVPKILELNNNPAMPNPSKNMSVLYRQHLVQFVSDIISFGLSDPPRNVDIDNMSTDSIKVDQFNFTRIW